MRRALRRDAGDATAAKEAELRRLEAARASEEALRLAARRAPRAADGGPGASGKVPAAPDQAVGPEAA